MALPQMRADSWFQGAVADVLAFHPRQRGEHGEDHAGRVVRALQLAGEELQADAAGTQLLGERGELDAASEPLVLVDDDRDGGTGRADFPGERDGPVELGPGGSGEFRMRRLGRSLGGC